MIDYAKVKALEQENIKSEVKVKTLSVNPLHLAIIIILAFLIYALAYQNMSIATTKHTINRKKAILSKLILKQQTLMKYQSKALNLSAILTKTTLPESPYSFKIEH